MAVRSADRHTHTVSAATWSAAEVGIMITRVALGVIFIAHGGQKVFGWWDGPGLQGFAEGMTKMGMPVFMGHLAALVEFIGGVLLVVGLFSRAAALGIFAVMVVALGKVHLSGGFFAPKGFEYNLALMAMAMTVMLGGPGAFALADPERRLFGRTHHSHSDDTYRS